MKVAYHKQFELLNVAEGQGCLRYEGSGEEFIAFFICHLDILCAEILVTFRYFL